MPVLAGRLVSNLHGQTTVTENQRFGPEKKHATDQDSKSSSVHCCMRAFNPPMKCNHKDNFPECNQQFNYINNIHNRKN